jgi:putative endonuclease
MPFYVYIIQSQKDNSFYKGFSESPYQRLDQHNNGESQYTSSKVPWLLVCLLEFDSKTEALIKERKLKKYSNASLTALIKSSQNKLLK